MKVKFLSYFIHSLDSCVLRKIIREVYKRNGYRINHLHDWVITHLNYLGCVLEIILEVYTSAEMYDFFEREVFVSHG